jgi:hypothetical protein
MATDHLHLRLRSIIVRGSVVLSALMLPLACLDVDPIFEQRDRGGVVDANPPAPQPAPSSPRPRPPESFEPPNLCPQFVPRQIGVAAPKAQACTSAEIEAIANACPLNTSMDGEPCLAARASYPACAGCIFATDNVGGDKPIMLTIARPGFQLNQHTCFDYATGIQGCGAAFVQQSLCADELCPERRPECWGGKTKSREECLESLSFGRCERFRADKACVAAARSSACFPVANTVAAYTEFFVRFTTLACGAGSIADAGGD